jgi:hypothetical protein
MFVELALPNGSHWLSLVRKCVDIEKVEQHTARSDLVEHRSLNFSEVDGKSTFDEFLFEC